MKTYILKVIHAAFEDAPIHVATVRVESSGITAALEDAYRMTQNLRGSWSKPEQFIHNSEVFDNLDFDARVYVEAPLHVKNGIEYGLRSTSVGDRVEVDGEVYKVAPAGFVKVAEIPLEEV